MTKYCTMINQDMIDLLTAKLSEWDSNWLSTYNDLNDPNVLILPNKTNAIIWVEDGFYEVTPYGVAYTDCNIGHTFKLTSFYQEKDWAAYQGLYLIGIQSKTFKVDVPLEYSIINLDRPYCYTRVMRPGKTIGDNAWFNSSEELEAWYTSGIDDFYNLVKALILIKDQYGMPGLASMSIKHRLTTDESPYYFKQADNWDKTPEWIVNQSLAMGKAALDHFVSSGATTRQFADKWYQDAATKWNTLL